MASRTQYYAATSIDGFLADDEHGLDWLTQFGFEEFQDRYDSFIAAIGAIVMGARSYEFMLGLGDDSWTYADTPCWVLTHGKYRVPSGANVRFASGDIAAVHADAVEAAGDKNVWLMGGGDVAAQFGAHGLIDDLILTVTPVLLGSGKRLHPDVAVTDPIRLVSTHTYASGAIELAYAMR